MTRKVKAFLCALLMVLTLAMPQMGGSAAAASVIYTAMNDSLLELSDETMPFWSGSYLYLPASAVVIFIDRRKIGFSVDECSHVPGSADGRKRNNGSVGAELGLRLIIHAD